MMNSNIYIVATTKQWNLKIYNEKIRHYPGVWHLITQKEELRPEMIARLKPKYIFFPHWSHIVADDILGMTDCVCFHETDLPYGRGGSPLQNLIALGHRDTVISALKMVGELDAGPVYLKRPLSLEGIAEEIFLRASQVVADMIKTIITQNIVPQKQMGKTVIFRRRTPEQSQVPSDIDSLSELFDHIRMLDATSYPKAYLTHGNFRYEISRPALRTDEIHADIRIKKIGGKK